MMVNKSLNLDLFLLVIFLRVRFSWDENHHEANHQSWENIFGSLFPGIELPANPRNWWLAWHKKNSIGVAGSEWVVHSRKKKWDKWDK